MAKKTVRAVSGTRKREDAPRAAVTKRRPVKNRRDERDLYRRLADIDASDADPLEKYQLRKVATESWRRRSRIHDVEAAQAQHSPTVEIAVDDPEDRKKVRKNSTRVRKSEAWRHNQLTDRQRDAQTEMEFAWTVRTVGLGAAVSNYGRPRGSAGGRLDTFADVEMMWRDWVREALIKKIHISAVIDCIAEPRTLPEIERAHRLRPGRAMANYLRGLDLWGDLRGRKRNRSSAVVDSEPTVEP